MLLMDTELAKKAIVEAKVRIPAMAKLKDNKKIDLYFLYFNNEEYIIAEIDWNNDNKIQYYMVEQKEIGDTILPDEKWNEVLDTGIKTLREVVTLLKDIKKMK